MFPEVRHRRTCRDLDRLADEKVYGVDPRPEVGGTDADTIRAIVALADEYALMVHDPQISEEMP